MAGLFYASFRVAMDTQRSPCQVVAMSQQARRSANAPRGAVSPRPSSLAAASSWVQHSRNTRSRSASGASKTRCCRASGKNRRTMASEKGWALADSMSSPTGTSATARAVSVPLWERQICRGSSRRERAPSRRHGNRDVLVHTSSITSFRSTVYHIYGVLARVVQ